MGMSAILFKDAEPFEQIDNIPLSEGSMWNLVKMVKLFQKMFMIIRFLYMYVSQVQRQITPGDNIFNVTKRVCYFDHTL